MSPCDEVLGISTVTCTPLSIYANYWDCTFCESALETLSGNMSITIPANETCPRTGSSFPTPRPSTASTPTSVPYTRGPTGGSTGFPSSMPPTRTSSTAEPSNFSLCGTTITTSTGYASVNYVNNMYCVVLFDTGGQDLRLNFTKLETEKSYDYLYIDAHYINETNFVPRFEYSGNYTPFEVTVLVNLPTDDPSLGSDLLIALVFVSDGSVLSGGVDFSWMFGNSGQDGSNISPLSFTTRWSDLKTG